MRFCHQVDYVLRIAVVRGQLCGIGLIGFSNKGTDIQNEEATEMCCHCCTVNDAAVSCDTWGRFIAAIVPCDTSYDNTNSVG